MAVVQNGELDSDDFLKTDTFTLVCYDHDFFMVPNRLITDEMRGWMEVAHRALHGESKMFQYIEENPKNKKAKNTGPAVSDEKKRIKQLEAQFVMAGSLFDGQMDESGAGEIWLANIKRDLGMSKFPYQGGIFEDYKISSKEFNNGPVRPITHIYRWHEDF